MVTWLSAEVIDINFLDFHQIIRQVEVNLVPSSLFPGIFLLLSPQIFEFWQQDSCFVIKRQCTKMQLDPFFWWINFLPEQCLFFFFLNDNMAFKFVFKFYLFICFSLKDSVSFHLLIHSFPKCL